MSVVCGALAVMLLFAPQVAIAQTGFTNLGFENPQLPLASVMPPQQAVPGWYVYVPNGCVFYNTMSLGGTALILHDRNSPIASPLIGNYSLELYDGVDGETAAVWQIGTIPLGAKSVRFVASSLDPVVSFGGHALVAERAIASPGFSLFAADISPFAGLTGELRFSHTGLFDQVFFSSLPVPEPRALWLLALATGIALRRRLWATSIRCA